MKKILFSALALAVAGSVFAVNPEEVRIYLNPGHGSWESNDRPMATIDHPNFTLADGTRDTLRFFESNTNLRKEFGVMEKLIEYGFKFDRTLNQDNPNPARLGAGLDMRNNIVFSHVKVGPYPTKDMPGYDANLKEAYNRSLSEISLEVDANNFDYFVSIHSNATNTDATNSSYPLYLYRGEDSAAQVPGSKELFQAMWPHWIANPHYMWTAYLTSTNIRGDWDFYGSHSEGVNGADGYLGVLKHHAIGGLIEGYFHTYQPARHKAMNWDADYMEGYAYARGIADHLGLQKEATGCIYGVVRDLHETFSRDAYKPNASTLDRFMPLNGVTVILKKGGEEVARYVTDNEWNGVFVFKDIETGDYTINFEAEGYKPLDEDLAVSVAAAETTYPTAQIESTSWEPPTVVYVNYPDEYKNGASGIGASLTVEQGATKEIAELEGKTVRRMVQHGDYLYILGLDADNVATLIVYNPATGEVVANVSTEGMDGTELNCSDIQVTSDGFLLACNKEITQCDDAHVESTDKRRGTFRIYKWANDEKGLPTGTPECWLTSQYTGNWYRSFAGETFAYTGTSQEGGAIFSCETTGSSHNLRTQYLSVIEGNLAGESYHQPAINGDKANFTVATLTNNYHFTTSPLKDDVYYVVSEGDVPVLECNFTHVVGADVLSMMNDALPTSVAGAGFFKHNGYSLMASPEVAEGKVVGINLTNVTKNIANAAAVNVVNGAVEAAEVTRPHAAGRTVAVWDALHENVTDGWMELYLLSGNKLTTYTTKGVEQPVEAAVYAYALEATETADGYTIAFKATGEAPAAKLVVYGEEETVVELGAVVKGDNSFTVDKNDLPEVESKWAVAVESYPNATAGRVLDTNKNMTNTTRGGVAFIDDPNSPSFGKIVMSYGFAQGLEVYDQELNSIGTYWVGDSHFAAGNGSSTMRVNTYKGKAYVSDWSDGGAGYWIFDPENTEAGVQNLLAGTKNSGGTYSYDGVAIGGGNTSIAFVENGDKTDMWVFCEDYPEVDASHLIVYDVTNLEGQINYPPYLDLGRHKMDNINVALYPYSGGVIAGQTRGSGNNQPGCPSFMIFSKEGDEIFNSGSDLAILDSSTGAVALNPAEDKLAVATLDGVQIYSFAVDEFGPVCDFLYTIPNSISRGYASEYTEFDFDQAGNLLAYERSCGLQVFALRNDAPVATTPANDASLLRGFKTGVEAIALDNVDGQAVYYDLQGRRVAADNMLNGVYVKVQGQKASKVLVK